MNSKDQTPRRNQRRYHQVCSFLVLSALAGGACKGTSPAASSSASPSSPLVNEVCASEHALGPTGACAHYPGLGWACVDHFKQIGTSAQVWQSRGKPWQAFPDEYSPLWLAKGAVCGQKSNGQVKCSGLTIDLVKGEFVPGALRDVVPEFPSGTKALSVSHNVYWVEAEGIVWRSSVAQGFVPHTKGLTNVVEGASISCGWNSDEVRCWGTEGWAYFEGKANSTYSEFGLTRRGTSAPIENLPQKLVQVSYYDAGCALTDKAEVYCWGKRWSHGQGEDEECPNEECPRSLRQAQRVPIEGVKEIGVALREVYALKQDGSVWSWGYRPPYDGPSKLIPPTQISALGTDNKRLFVTDDVQCVAKNSGSLTCWGELARHPGPWLPELKCEITGLWCSPREIFPACVSN